MEMSHHVQIAHHQAPTQPNADLINKQHNLNGAHNSRDVNTANGTPINESNINSSMDTS